MSTPRLTFLTALAAVALALTTPAASAGTILLPSDVFTVYDGSLNIVYQQFINEFDETQNNFFVTPIAGDSSQVDSPIFLLEPNRSFSDAFGVVQVPVYDNVGDCIAINYFVAFESDSEMLFGNTAVGAGVIFVPEGNGGPFDATMYLAPSLRQAGWTASFQSDAEM